MDTYWMLILVWFSPTQGLQYYEQLGYPMYSSYEDCMKDYNDGVSTYSQYAIDNTVTGGCYLIAEPGE